MLHYGEKLKSLREKRGLSVKDVAVALGVKPVILTKGEATGQFSVALVPPLSKLFKVPVQKFMRMSGRKKAVPAAPAKSADALSTAPKPKKAVAAKAPAPVPAKRGRPKKAATETALVPAKRGRPKKVAVAPAAPAEKAQTNTTAPKKRGRPKKVANGNVQHMPVPDLEPEIIDDGLYEDVSQPVL